MEHSPSSTHVPQHESLRGRWASLEPVTPDNYSDLYELSIHPGLSYRWLHRGLPLLYEAFVAEIRNSFLAQFVICKMREETMAGFAVPSVRISAMATARPPSHCIR